MRFEVQDQGPGIAKEHQRGLFEKFFRVPGSPAGGSGLGLFIAKGLVQAHGGTIGVESARGSGRDVLVHGADRARYIFVKVKLSALKRPVCVSVMR